MTAKYKQLASRLTDLITANLHNGIYKLPTEAELGRQFQASRQTVRQALSLLKAQGLIITRQGSGSYATGLSEDDSPIRSWSAISALSYRKKAIHCRSFPQETRCRENGKFWKNCSPPRHGEFLRNPARAPCPIRILIATKSSADERYR